MARIGNETAFALEPGLEPCEHRPERRGGKCVARKRGEQQDEWATEKELRPQGGERVVPVLERGAGDHDEVADGRTEQANAVSLDDDRLLPGARELTGPE